MLPRRRYAWGKPDPQPHGTPPCVSTGRSPEKPAVPRRLNATDPQRLATVAEATPRHDGVSFVHGYFRPAGRSRDGSSLTSLNPASDAGLFTLGPSRERTAMAGAVALAAQGT